MESNAKQTAKLFEIFMWCAVCELELFDNSKRQALYNSLSEFLSQNGYPITSEWIHDPSIEYYESFRYKFLNYFEQIYTSPLNRNTCVQTGRYHNDFDETRIISKGSFGKVFEAKSRIDGQSYAVKKIALKGFFGDESPHETDMKILNEVKVCAQLTRSKFIVQYMTAWLEQFNTMLYIQMELCSMTLKQAIPKINAELAQCENKPLTRIGAYIATEFFAEILKGVQYLHRRFIHRDLKLSNILITLTGDKHFVKLCDFGLTRKFPNQWFSNRVNSTDATDADSENNGIEPMTQCAGTIGYMAGEVLDSEFYTKKADMFSVGVVMSELFNFDYKQFSQGKQHILETSLIDDNSDNFLGYSRKLLAIMKELCHKNDANRRSLSDKILNERREWSVKVDDIKCDELIKQICFDSTKFGALSNPALRPLSHTIILKKFEWHYDSLYSATNFCNHYSEIKAAKILKEELKPDTNIESEQLREFIFRHAMHALHIYGSYGDICDYLRSCMSKVEPNFKWYCRARMNYHHDFDQNAIRYDTVYYSLKFVDVNRQNAMLLIDVYRKM